MSTVEITCDNCEGTGWQLFTEHNGIHSQETCEVCKGNKKINVPKEMAQYLNGGEPQ